MKRFIITFMALFFSICMIVPITSIALDEEQEVDQYNMVNEIYNESDHIVGKVNEISDKIDGIETGASQESVDELKESVDNIDVKQGVDDYFTEKFDGPSSEDTSKYGFSLVDSLIGVLETVWKEVPKLIGIGTEKSIWQVTLDPKKEYNGTFYGIFVTIGYSLVLVFFAANLIETTIKYEIFTLKGGVQIFGRLIVSKVIIDLSGKICIYILNICNYISKSILQNATANIGIESPNITAQAKSGLPIIGSLVDLVQGYFYIVPILLISLIMLIAALLIIFKLMLRSLELSLLMIVSPAFFACYSSEITKPYFKNFILTFLQCALQIVFMAVVYALSSDFILNINRVDSDVEAWAWFIKTLPNALLCLAIAIMMIKPPKVLTGLVR